MVKVVFILYNLCPPEICKQKQNLQRRSFRLPTCKRIYVPAAQNIDELPRLKVTRPELRSRLYNRVPRHPELAQLFLWHQSRLGEQSAVGPRVPLWIT